MKPIAAFQSADGALFATAAAATKHEKSLAPSLVVGLTEAQVATALDRSDADLADAFETIGRLCEAKRMEQGERRRKPKGSKVAENGQAAPQWTGEAVAAPSAAPAPGVQPEDQFSPPEFLRR